MKMKIKTRLTNQARSKLLHALIHWNEPINKAINVGSSAITQARFSKREKCNRTRPTHSHQFNAQALHPRYVTTKERNKEGKEEEEEKKLLNTPY